MNQKPWLRTTAAPAVSWSTRGSMDSFLSVPAEQLRDMNKARRRPPTSRVGASGAFGGAWPTLCGCLAGPAVTPPGFSWPWMQFFLSIQDQSSLCLHEYETSGPPVTSDGGMSISLPVPVFAKARKRFAWTGILIAQWLVRRRSELKTAQMTEDSASGRELSACFALAQRRSGAVGI